VSSSPKATQSSVPVDPATGDPLAPKSQPGYYPGYSTLSQQKYWDEATRKVVLERVSNVPPIRFFSPEQARLLTAVCDRIIPQDDRDTQHRIPIVPFIDKRLHDGRIDGYRFEDMPPDREAYHLGLEGIEAESRQKFEQGFADLTFSDQEQVLRAIHHGKPISAEHIWKHLPIHRFWMLLVQDCVEVYYAHPWAWDEIGYGGPAYPRAYMRLEGGQAEPWEVNEKRYEWDAPPESVSDNYDFVAGEEEHHGSPGQGGTH